MKIMIVEDDADIRELVDIVASGLGVDTKLAATASEALQVLENGFLPDMILLDLVLPDMSGADFVKAVRANDLWKHLKIIIASGKSDLPFRAKEMNANGSFAKPFDIDNLEDLLRLHAR